MMQLEHFDAALRLFQVNPGRQSKELTDLIHFLSHVAPLFPKEGAAFPAKLIELLKRHADALHGSVRKGVVQALCLLRNRNAVPATDVLPLFFQLFKSKDRELRHLLLSHIVGDIKRSNAKVKNPQENRALQNFMYKILSADDPIMSRHSLWVILDLYRRGIWTDDRVVNVVTSACFSKHTKVMQMALRFFLGHFPRDMNNEDEEEEEELHMPSKKQRRYSKKTKARNTAREKLKDLIKYRERKKEGQYSTVFRPIEVLNDPQGFAEKLFSQLQHTKERFDIRILHIGVISKVVSAHELVILNLYPYLQRYMEPHQQHVTHLLAYSAQAVHHLIPPDAIHSLMMTIANHFVNDKASPDAIAVGINTIREICKRQPLVMTEDLLRDITQYKRYKRDKGVVMASRSMIQLFKELQPAMLERKDRGRSDSDAKLSGFGTKTTQGIEGIELLQEYYQKKKQEGEEEEEDEDKEWEDDASESSSGSWVDVQHSDSDDEAEDAEGKEEEEGSGAGGSDGEGWEEVSEEENEEDEEMEEEGEDGEGWEEVDEDEEEDEEEDMGVVEDTEGKEGGDTARDILKRKAAEMVDYSRLAETKFLTPRDFQRIRELQEQAVAEGPKKKNRKRKAAEEDGEEVTADILEAHSHKRRRRDAEERAAHTEVIRERFKAKTKLAKKKGGSTNRMKRRGKNAAMVMNSARVTKKRFETAGVKRARNKKADKKNTKFRYQRK
eukprot:Hpha_TRINITY_DN15166_c3_g3::TRINITY_DN15166_c3_g3_i1::g.130065::m.130065/K14856/SDA1, SDAD1; protein SDA1